MFLWVKTVAKKLLNNFTNYLAPHLLPTLIHTGQLRCLKQKNGNKNLAPRRTESLDATNQNKSCSHPTISARGSRRSVWLNWVWPANFDVNDEFVFDDKNLCVVVNVVCAKPIKNGGSRWNLWFFLMSRPSFNNVVPKNLLQLSSNTDKCSLDNKKSPTKKKIFPVQSQSPLKNNLLIQFVVFE